jgi:FkbM family methyltransferase
MLVDEVFHLLRSNGEVSIKIGDVSLTLDLRHPHERRYAICAVADVRYPQKDIDTALFSAFIEPGDHVLDLGANIGLTALEALECGAANVLCVEPVESLIRRIPEDPRLDRLQAAVTDRDGEAEITLSQSHNQGSTISADVVALFPNVFEGGSTERVSAVTIDGLGDFDVWKLDVEGAEGAALRGASETLKRKPPRVIIAEIYEPFLPEVRALLATSHPTQLRAGISLESYELTLCEPEQFDVSAVYQTSPMYIFSTVGRPRTDSYSTT